MYYNLNNRTQHRKKGQKMKATNKQEAWQIVDKIFPTDYMKNEQASANAGYPIYTSTAEGTNAWISDLNTRLEVNFPNGKTENIWIDDAEERIRKQLATKTKELYS